MKKYNNNTNDCNLCSNINLINENNNNKLNENKRTIELPDNKEIALTLFHVHHYSEIYDEVIFKGN